MPETSVQSDPADEIGILVLYFVFFTILLGAVVTYGQYLVPHQFSVLKEMPYVVVVFIIGFVIGISTSSDGNVQLGVYSSSMLVWENFPPELLIYMFIPVLIYEEVTNLNLHHFKTTVGQGLVLAFPAAIAGTFILAAIINANGIPFPVDWGSNAVYLFSSILCATDSVSVVSLLSKMELFRSQKLKYIIINESLFNDATALVLYTVFLSSEISDQFQSTFTASEALIYTVEIIVISPLIGLAFGIATVIFIYLINDPHNEVFMVLRSVITIASAYLSFLLANYQVLVSGILSTIFNGLVFMYRLPAFFKHYEEVHAVWHALGWISNTMIFHVAGLVFGYRTLGYFTLSGFANIVIIYVYLFVVRAMTLLFFYPLLNWLGKGVTFNEMVFMVFSGLRGAISVALALNLSLLAEGGYLNTLTIEQANTIFLYTGGVSGLSLILNANMAEYVLKLLALSEKQTEVSYETQLMRNSYKRQLMEASAKDWLEIPFAHRLLIKTKCRLLNDVDDYTKSQGMQNVVSTDTVFSGNDHPARENDKYFPAVPPNEDAISALQSDISARVYIHSQVPRSPISSDITHLIDSSADAFTRRPRAETKDDTTGGSRFGLDSSQVEPGYESRGDRSHTIESMHQSVSSPSRKNTAMDLIHTLTQHKKPTSLPAVATLPTVHSQLDLSSEELQIFMDLEGTTEEGKAADDIRNWDGDGRISGDDDDFYEPRPSIDATPRVVSRDDRERASSMYGGHGVELSEIASRRHGNTDIHAQPPHIRSRQHTAVSMDASELEDLSAILNPYMNDDEFALKPQVSAKMHTHPPNYNVTLSAGMLTPVIEESASQNVVSPRAPSLSELQQESSDMFLSTLSDTPVINEQLLGHVRSTFLECVRAFYLHKVRKGVLQRYADVFRYLMASVDFGLESASTTELQDWDYIERVVTPHPSLIDFKWVLELERVKPIYNYLKKHLKVVRRWDRKFHEDCMNTLNYFAFAHQYAQKKILSAFDLSQELTSPEVEFVVRESQIVVRLAMLKLHSTMHDERMLQYRYTKDKVLGILEGCENVLFDLQSEHIITTSDLEYFLEMISEERIAFKKLFRNIRKMFEVSLQRQTLGSLEPEESFSTHN